MRIVLKLTTTLLVLFLASCHMVAKREQILLKNAGGVETTLFQFHESVLLDAIELQADTAYSVQIKREDGKPVTDLVLTTDHQGRIPEAVIWYDIGELPYPEQPTNIVPAEDDILDFEYAGKGYELLLLLGDDVVYETTFRVTADDIRPTLYATDALGPNPGS
jgi:hypothetical protein